MILHIYDHCPFCVRARMAFRPNGVPVTLNHLLNDDVETPTRMIGKKMAPILEDDDGYLPESMDILHKIDGLDGAPRFTTPASAALQEWTAGARDLINRLVMPRTADPVYEEFATEGARAFYTRAKQEMIGDFDAHLARTDAYLEELAPMLGALVPLLPAEGPVSLDDVQVWPFLRGLTIVDGLEMPAPVAAYVARISAAVDIPTVPELRAAKAA